MVANYAVMFTRWMMDEEKLVGLSKNNVLAIKAYDFAFLR
jgi:hypothetical protein